MVSVRPGEFRAHKFLLQGLFVPSIIVGEWYSFPSCRLLPAAVALGCNYDLGGVLCGLSSRCDTS